MKLSLRTQISLFIMLLVQSAWAQKAIVVEDASSSDTSFEGTQIIPLSSRYTSKSSFQSVEDLKTAKKLGLGASLSGLGLLNALVEVNVTYDQAIQVGLSAFSTTQNFMGGYRYSFKESNAFEVYSLVGGGFLLGNGGSVLTSIPKSNWLSESEISSGKYSLMMFSTSLGASYTFIEADQPGLGVFAELNAQTPINKIKPLLSAQLGSVFYF